MKLVNLILKMTNFQRVVSLIVILFLLLLIETIITNNGVYLLGFFIILIAFWRFNRFMQSQNLHGSNFDLFWNKKK
jgi:hypothetical protein